MKNKRTIFIELTSLLDVILILIFVLLSQAKSQTALAMDQAKAQEQTAREISREMEEVQKELKRVREEAEADLLRRDEQIRDLEQERDLLREEAEGLKRQLASREIVLENSILLTLSVAQNGSIRLEEKDKAALQIDYSWTDETYAFNRLRTLLSSAVREAGEKSLFLVFQYDRKQIYKAQYDMILRAVQEMKNTAGSLNIPLNVIEMDLQG